MARRKKKKKIESTGGNWLTTFSDLMSLLLTFFILLFSMSNVSEEKFNAASYSMQGALVGEVGSGFIFEGNGISNQNTGDADGDGPGKGGSAEIEDAEGSKDPAVAELENTNEEAVSEGIEGSNELYVPNESYLPPETAEPPVTPENASVAPIDQPTSNPAPSSISEVSNQATQVVTNAGISDRVAVTSDQAGVYLDIKNSVLFTSGQATISPSGKATLDSLAQLLNSTDNDIVVAGYTDNQKVKNSNYQSNWDLSAARAMAVVHYLAEEKGVNPSRLSGRGYGENNPIVPNDTPENRERNRRVNIMLVHQP